MTTRRVNTESMEWAPANSIYGPEAVYDGKELIQLKILSDRRAEGAGIAYLVRFLPPPGKAIKMVAVARSDEHTFILAGGRGTKSGDKLRFSGDYSLNPTGQPHSAIISVETTGLVVYAGEPDEIKSISVVDIH